jgi:hypothetical protein
VAGQYFFKIDLEFLPLSGGTVSGNTYFNSNLSANTYFSGTTNLEDIIFNIASQVSQGTGLFLPLSGGTGGPYKFIGNTTGETFYVESSIEPTIDNFVDLGKPLKRFRRINTVEGVSTVWSATTSIHTPEINLGLDSNSENRIITANNSIIQDDKLFGGNY